MSFLIAVAALALLMFVAYRGFLPLIVVYHATGLV